MVQAVKDPMKSKGARLTTEISLPGRFLVYVPNGEGSGCRGDSRTPSARA
jgi:Ribonuclease G/E